jgi:hypothetical protein
MAGDLVLKEWYVGTKGNPTEEPLVSIVGRAPGFMAFLLNIIGLDPTTTMQVSSKAVYFTTSSIKGQETRVIPLSKISSTYYGYNKPVEYLIAAVATSWTCIGPIIFIILYFLKKSLTLAVVEQSGVISAIRFKASVIEGIEVNEQECENVNNVIRDLLLAYS